MTAQQAPDYLAIGHVTVDLRPDGTPVLGGTALYAALTAARFGLRAAILTRGNFTRHGDAIREQLQRFAAEVEIIVQSAETPTIFTNLTVAGRRQQTLHAWAGPIDVNGLPPHWRSARIVHLGPVAQEIDARQVGRLSPDYFGATPQGWMRNLPRGRKGNVTLGQLRLPFETLSRIDALVMNSEEATHARDAIDFVGRRGLVAITRNVEGVQVTDRGRVVEFPAYPARVVDDVGAGDVFAAALFLLRAEGESVAAAVRMANAAATLRIQGEGPDAVPTREATRELLKRVG